MKKITFLLLIISTGLTSLKTNAQNPSMTKIEGGTFKMTYKDDSVKSKKTYHNITLSSFELSTHEVTVAQWKEFLTETLREIPNRPKWGWREDFPITNIKWTEAIVYCNWLSKKNNLTLVYTKDGNNWICNFKANGYRLPTEAEWEYAAKGGNKSKKFIYAGGNDLNLISWYSLNSKKSPQTIETKLPNELGLFDMSGNTWEWVWDYYSPLYSKTIESTNPTGPIRGTNRCLKGGSWDSSKLQFLKPEYQLNWNPNETNEFFGFRIARSIVE